MTEHQRPRFTYLGHSTVRCDLPGGEVVLIDPWVYSNPRCPAELHQLDRLDALLITHGHSDHLGEAVELARRYRPAKVVSNYEICEWLTAEGVENCSGMNPGGKQEVCGCQVAMVRADHSSSIDSVAPPVYGGLAGGFVIRMPGGYTFYHAGDTALFLDMQLIAELYRPELAFLPIGDLYTMDPQQAARACRFLEIRQVIPIHWGTFPGLTGTPDGLREALNDLGIKCEVITLQPGDRY